MKRFNKNVLSLLQMLYLPRTSLFKIIFNFKLRFVFNIPQVYLFLTTPTEL